MSSFAANIRPHVDAELRAAMQDPQNGFAHLDALTFSGSRPHAYTCACTGTCCAGRGGIAMRGSSEVSCCASWGRPPRRSSAWCPRAIPAAPT